MKQILLSLGGVLGILASGAVLWNLMLSLVRAVRRIRSRNRPY